jgi:hypothetical protein
MAAIENEYSFFSAIGSYYVAQAGLKLMILLLRLPNAEITGLSSHAQLHEYGFLNKLISSTGSKMLLHQIPKKCRNSF